MKIELRYFTGTGNSLKIVKTCSDVFTENNHTVEISGIKKDDIIPEDTDIIGFCFPVYAFGIPRICTKYLEKIPKFSETRNAFVLVTAGDKNESGFSVSDCIKILKKKNCRIIYSDVIEMPINWIPAMNPPSEDEARIIIEKGIKQAREVANNILNGAQKFHIFNVPVRYGRFGLYREFYLFKYLGINNLWRTFKVYDTCNGCRLCSRICPTGSIRIEADKPVWSSSCEQCMRCINFCPEEAIYQSMGGDTKGKNRYYEPDFKPQLEKQAR